MSSLTGNLIVVSAASGAGKTSLVNALVDRDERIALAVSHTTRLARPGEIDGQHYHFVNDEQFAAMVADGAFLEHANVFDRRYGTAKAQVDAQREAGLDVLLEIDWQGARQIRQAVPEAQSIFIVPPSLAALRARLTGRGQDSVETIERRMAAARNENRQYREFDFLIVNDEFETALEQLHRLIISLRLRTPLQQARWTALLDELT